MEYDDEVKVVGAVDCAEVEAAAAGAVVVVLLLLLLHDGESSE